MVSATLVLGILGVPKLLRGFLGFLEPLLGFHGFQEIRLFPSTSLRRAPFRLQKASMARRAACQEVPRELQRVPPSALLHAFLHRPCVRFS